MFDILEERLNETDRDKDLCGCIRGAGRFSGLGLLRTYRPPRLGRSAGINNLWYSMLSVDCKLRRFWTTSDTVETDGIIQCWQSLHQRLCLHC